MLILDSIHPQSHKINKLSNSPNSSPDQRKNVDLLYKRGFD